MEKSEIREARAEDIPEISAIYRDSFPSHTRTQLGVAACVNYFNKIMTHRAYKLLTALRSGEVVGFLVIHIDPNDTIGRRWMFDSIASDLKLAIKRPLFVMNRFFSVLYAKIKRGLNPPPKSELERTAWLDLMAIRKDSRRMGFATDLMNMAYELARKNGRKKIKFAVNTDNEKAIKLYEGLGYIRLSEDKKIKQYTYGMDFAE